MEDIHTRMMRAALDEARKAGQSGEVPIGAVVYDAAGNVIAAAHNRVEAGQAPTAHAEFLAATLASAARAKGGGDRYLSDCYVAVTLEPCAMCAQALSWLRVKGIYYGASDPKSGGLDNGARVLAHAHHKPTVIGGLLEAECGDILKTFFAGKR